MSLVFFSFFFLFSALLYLTSQSVSYLSPGVGGVPVERVAVYSGPGWAS